MQLPESRKTLLQIAKLELTHLWHCQQQQQQLQRPGGAYMDGEAQASASARASRAQEPRQDLWPAALSTSVGRSEGDGEQSSRQRDGRDSGEGVQSATRAAQPSAQTGVAAASAAGVGSADASAGADEDDIFAAADRMARARAQQQQQQQELRQQEQQSAQQQQPELKLQGVTFRDPLLALPTDVQLRLRELQRRAEAYGQPRGGSLPVVLRNVAEAFEQRVSYGRAAPSAASVGGGAGCGLSPATALEMAQSIGAGTAHGLRRRQMAIPADLQLQPLLPQQTGKPPPSSYWAEHPLLSYGDNVLALAVRQGTARRLESAGGPDGKRSLVATVASLSASAPRDLGAPSTPVLSLLVDLLQLKYLDLLHSWEVAARLGEAMERADRAGAQQRKTLTVQAGELLPAPLYRELSGSWAQAAAAFRPSVLAPLLQPNDAGGSGTVGAGPAPAIEAQQRAAHQALASRLDWSSVAAALSGLGSADATAMEAARTAAAAGDLRAAVQHTLAPALAAAAARHQALLAGTDATRPAMVAAVASDAGAVSFPHAPSPAAASVACFRETLVLDASSAFADASHDCRVTLEFDVDRLAASEPALGGAWGARLMERLLAPPSALTLGGSGRRRFAPGGSMAGRARRGPAARAALLARAHPVDVDRRFCRRTRIASLTTCRYPSREANRKLLLETYGGLLAAVAGAAAGGRG